MAAIQEPPATPPQAGAVAPSPQLPQPTFRGSTTVVEVDVIVRDKKRQFVADLRLEDFEVREDGVPQTPSVLYRVIGPAEFVRTGKTGEVPEPPPVSDVPEPPARQMQRVMVFVFDQAHIQPGGFTRARKAAREFLKNSFRTGDVGGVVYGGTMLNGRLTNSVTELDSAIESIKPSNDAGQLARELREWPRFVDTFEAEQVVRRAPSQSPGPTALDDVLARACRERPDDCQRNASTLVEAEIERKATAILSAEKVLSKQTITTLAALTNGLGRVPGRKTVILLTDGFYTEDNMGAVRDVVERAARASVRFYALDTRGLNKGSASGDIFAAEAPSQPEMSRPSFGDSSIDGPNSLAVDTGGVYIRNENDFVEAFEDIDRDTSSYYVVGFRSTQPADGKYHTLSVKISRPGVAVRARRGYVATAGPVPVAPPQPMAPPDPAASVVAPAAAEPSTAASFKLEPKVVDNVARLEGKIKLKPSAGHLSKDLERLADEGWEAYQRGDVEAAKASLLQVTANPAAAPWMHYVLGWTYLALSEAEPAATSWEKVRAAAPEFKPVYFDLADAYLRQRDFGRAIDVLRAAERRWPKEIEVYAALGVAQVARGAIDDAVRSFEIAVSLEGEDANACYNLAKTYELRYTKNARLRQAASATTNAASMTQDREQAKEYYRRVVRLGGPLVASAQEGLERLGAKD
jgi:VWFA-related protein